MKARNLTPNKKDKGKKLWVDEMFFSIQTEGPLAGRPAYFVRLFGCNLNCSFCDTPQTAKPKHMKIKEILATIMKKSTTRLVVLTGGEPTLQNIHPLVDMIIRAGMIVQIETNGCFNREKLPLAAIPEKSPGVYVVVSPKTKKIDSDIAASALAFKYVVSTDNVNPRNGLPKGLYTPADLNSGRIMISPMFVKSKKKTKENIEMAVTVCKTFGYYLSIQYHKFINIK